MIGYVLRYWPTLSETFVAREIAELRRRGHRVEVIAMGRRADPRPGEPVPDLVVHRPPRGTALVPVAFTTSVARWTDKWALRAVWAARVLRSRGVRRVHAHFAGEAARLARDIARQLGVPFSVTVHAHDLFVPIAGLGPLLAEASPVVTIADHHAKVIADRYGVSSRVVRCGVPVKRFATTDPGAARRFVCIARDVDKKGLDTLIEAMADVPAVLRLVSNGVRHGRPRVLAGPAAAAAIPSILATALAFVLPCRIAADGDRDGIPVALMEAMACGVPVITTAVSGIPELVDETVGWWVPPNDPSALAATMRKVLANPEARRRRGAAARARIEARFTLTAQVDGLLEAWSARGAG